VEKKIKGEAAAKILAVVFPELVKTLQFHKTMVWEASRFRFARPLRTLVGLYGTKAVSFTVAGVKSSRKTPVLSVASAKTISIDSPDNYVRLLSSNGITVMPEERRKLLKETVTRTAELMKSVPLMDEGLVEETVYLAEHPVAVTGNFSMRFLKLPPELIITVLKTQLKFFPLLSSDGKIQPYFIAVRDGSSENQQEVAHGFESVVEARLSDAVFFFEKDLARKLSDMRARLDGVLFNAKTGSMANKARRTAEVAGWLAETINTNTFKNFAKGGNVNSDTSRIDSKVCAAAADLAYADLTSEVVREFPELQGYMGGEYAAAENMGAKTALCLREFYFPASSGAALPSSAESAVVSLAGKVDTLSSDFVAGMKPTGSEDPHGLRRQALGAVRIMLERKLPVAIAELVSRSLDAISKDCPDASSKEMAAEICEFLWQRAETIFADAGFRMDEIRAVKNLSVSLAEIQLRLNALHEARKNADFESVAVSFKRVSNILKKEPAADGEVNTVLLGEEAEKNLSSALLLAEKEISPSLASASEGGYLKAFSSMAALRPAVDKFFEDVMVMAEDPAVRRNRLALLARLHKLLSCVADLSQLQQ